MSPFCIRCRTGATGRKARTLAVAGRKAVEELIVNFAETRAGLKQIENAHIELTSLKRRGDAGICRIR
jgi:hypothetical protein